MFPGDTVAGADKAGDGVGGLKKEVESVCLFANYGLFINPSPCPFPLKGRREVYL